MGVAPPVFTVPSDLSTFNLCVDSRDGMHGKGLRRKGENKD